MKYRPDKRPGVVPGIRPVQHEEAEQVALFEWAKLMETKHPELAFLYASLNGVRLSRAQAGKAKAMGMKAGVPDLHLDLCQGKYVGLVIELKRAGKRGKVSKDQARWLKWSESQRRRAVVCRGCKEAIAAILAYLKKPEGMNVIWE